MENSDFDALLEKYRKGECTPEELDFLESWYLQYHANAEELSESDLEHEVGMMDESMAHKIPFAVDRPSVWSRLRLPLGIAAAILIVCSMA